MDIPRLLKTSIINKLLTTNQGVVIYGARQVGKTTLVKQIIAELNLKTLEINADQRENLDSLSSANLRRLKALVAGYELLFIDEAQRIPDIGINLKIILDNIPIKVITTGSSSFELANRIHESLTGRVWTYMLYPISIAELKQLYPTPFELDSKREELLIYGSYPKVLKFPNYADKRDYLEEISHSYLYKDILELAEIRHSEKIHSLLKLLAYQVGSLVSIRELGNILGLSFEAVDRYIDLLEKSFVLFRLGGLSRNLRKEIAKMKKIYFYDCGIRNAIIGNFSPLQERADVGQLWENFLMVERHKLLSSHSLFAHSYFWRTHTGAELDYVEEREGKLLGYEFKYNHKKTKAPQTWLETYNNAKFDYVNVDNYLDFITSTTTSSSM